MPRTRRTRRTTVALAAAAALVIPAAPASAATVSDPIIEGQITPLGLAVDGSDIYVANAFAGFLSVKGDPTYFVPGQPGGALTGVAVQDDTVAYTATVIPELDPDPGVPDTFLYVSSQEEPLANLGAWEALENPDQNQSYGLLEASPSCLQKVAHKIGPDALPYSGRVDSNPYAVASDGGTGWYVADAAANAILHVSQDGTIETVAVLPPVPQVLSDSMRREWRVPRLDGQPNAERVKLPRCAVGQTYYGEPVPTDVEVGGDGMLYVSLLPGFPEVGGRVVKVDPDTGTVLATLARGLAGAVDVAVDGSTIYVAELFGNRVSKWSGGSMVDSTFVLLPGAVEVDGGTLFATAGALVEEPPFGSVVTITF
jgi:hypothetical protein